MLKRKDYLNRLKNIKLVSIDVDGTMTDGSLYYLDQGGEARRYNVRDGVGVLLLQTAGVQTVMLTTGHVDSIRLRGEKLAMDHIKTGVFDKKACLLSLCKELGIHMADVAHIGDDINDVSAFEDVGLAVVVQDANRHVLPYAGFQLQSKGGCGAIREFAEDYYEATHQEVTWALIEEFVQKRKKDKQHKLSNG